MTKFTLNIPPLKTLVDARNIINDAFKTLGDWLSANLPLVNYQGKRIENVGNPVSESDVATKKYVDNKLLEKTEINFTDIKGTANVKQLPLDSRAINTQTDVTGSRAIGSVYQNTTGKPLWVSVTVGAVLTPSLQAGLTFKSDSATTPTTVIALALLQTGAGSTVTVYIPVTFVVLPGNYYSTTQYNGTTSASVYSWIEWY